jgi:hypothetical protein
LASHAGVVMAAQRMNPEMVPGYFAHAGHRPGFGRGRFYVLCCPKKGNSTAIHAVSCN